MSPTDNVVQFRKASGPATTQEDAATAPAPVDEAGQAVQKLVTFLSENKAAIKCFVGSFLCEEGGPEGDACFHVITSPIEPAEFALALRVMEESFSRLLAPSVN